MACRRVRVIFVPALLSLITACSGGDVRVGETAPSVAAATSTTTDDPLTTAAAAPATPPPTTAIIDDGPLAEVCGDTIVVQTSNYPDVGAGPLYALLGATPSVDPTRQAVSAPVMRADGTVESTTLEIRSGGPAIGFRSSLAVMVADETIDLALASTAVAVRDRATLATRAVATLTDRSREAVIIDPATYPDVTDLATLGAQGVETRHVTDAPVIRFLVSSGVLSPDQLIAGSDGLPASFVEAAGVVAQQGDLTIEPVLFPSLQQWGRPVTALAASDFGWFSLDDLLLADTEVERVSDECLGRLVRVIQQSIVAYTADPSETNVVMSDIRSQFNPLARLTPPLLDLGTQLAIDSGVFDTTSGDAPGAIDTEGLDAFLVDLASALEVDPVSVDELVDPRFVDSTISR